MTPLRRNEPEREPTPPGESIEELRRTVAFLQRELDAARRTARSNEQEVVALRGEVHEHQAQQKQVTAALATVGRLEEDIIAKAREEAEKIRQQTLRQAAEEAENLRRAGEVDSARLHAEAERALADGTKRSDELRAQAEDLLADTEKRAADMRAAARADVENLNQDLIELLRLRDDLTRSIRDLMAGVEGEVQRIEAGRPGSSSPSRANAPESGSEDPSTA